MLKEEQVELLLDGPLGSHLSDKSRQHSLPLKDEMPPLSMLIPSGKYDPLIYKKKSKHKSIVRLHSVPRYRPTSRTTTGKDRTTEDAAASLLTKRYLNINME